MRHLRISIAQRRRFIQTLAAALLCLSAAGAALMLAVPSTDNASKTVSVPPALELEELVWRRLDEVELDPADEASVQSAIALDLFDIGSGNDDDNASGTDDREGQGPGQSRVKREARIRRAVEVAFVPSATESPFLLVRGPTLGNCADTHMVILGPRDPVGRRVAEEWLCTFEVLLRWTSERSAPDLVFPSAEFVFNVYRWLDGHSLFVETLIDDVNRTGHSPCGTAPAAREEEISGNFDCYVSVTLGSFDLKSIIQEPAIRARLRAGFGERYPTFLKNLAVRAPWRLIGDCLSITGNAPHRGGDEEAVLALCPGQNHVYAALLTDGELFLIARRTAPANLPLPIRDFLGVALDESAVLRKPLTWVD